MSHLVNVWLYCDTVIVFNTGNWALILGSADVVGVERQKDTDYTISIYKY